MGRRWRSYDYHADLDAHVECDGGEVGARCFTNGPLARCRARGNSKLDYVLCATG